MALVLMGALLLPGLSSGAFAAEGDVPLFPAVGDDNPGTGTVVPDPPSQGEPILPDPPPTTEPDPPSEPPVSEPSSDPGPSSSEPDASSDNSSWEPDDSSSEDESSSEGEGAGMVNPNPTPKRSGETSLKPPSSSRPKIALNAGSSSASPSGSSPDPSSLEPNYITFARLDQKANSMSMTLFYGGAGCVLFGVLGLVFLLALFVHNRRRRYADDRDGIFEEIAQAENRSPYAPQALGDLQPQRPQSAQRPAQTAQRSAQPARQAQRPMPPAQPPYYDPAPPQDNLYTEEFDLPQQEPIYYNDYSAPVQDSLYTEEFDPPEPSYAPPAQDSLYTEEFHLPQPPSPPRRPLAHVAPPKEPPKPQPQQRNPYDTEEILRELLGKDV